MKVFHWVNILMLAGLLVVSTSVNADDDFGSWLFSVERKNEVAPVKDDTYNEECGSCHFPYQPGLLPAASWKKLLDAKALEDHFGENAELDNDMRMQLLSFLERNAADKSYFKRSRKIMASLHGKTPLRIIEVPYIQAKHEDLTDKHIKNNPEVRSLSFCDACHQEIVKGRFDDDTVRIPGFGYWSW